MKYLSLICYWIYILLTERWNVNCKDSGKQTWLIDQLYKQVEN